MSGTSDPIRAGQAFSEILDQDPVLATTIDRKMRAFAASLKAIISATGAARLSMISSSTWIIEQSGLLEIERYCQDAKEELARVLEPLFTEAIRQTDDELVALGFEPPGSDIEKWLELAEIIGKDPSPMTLEKIRFAAVAWSKRERLLAKYRAEAVASVAAPRGDSAGPRDDETDHAPDFSWVKWDGVTYTFTNMQRPVVEALWNDWVKGGCGLSGGLLIEKSGTSATSRVTMSGLFKSNGKINPAWNSMIVVVDGSRDRYQLNRKK